MGVMVSVSSPAMETIPDRSRGLMSGTFQAGYPRYLFAPVIFGPFYSMVAGAACSRLAPRLFVAHIRLESAGILARLAARARKREYRAASCSAQTVEVVFVSGAGQAYALNFFSHGTQISYPTFLKMQHGFDPASDQYHCDFYNIAAMLGGIRHAIGTYWA